MKRVIAHWTAGTHTVSKIDKAHYHGIVDGSGRRFFGDNPISANAAPIKGPYAAHTLNCNTDSIGIAVACMVGAREKDNYYGRYPMTERQFEAMCEWIAELCKGYNIPVTNRTVLSHAEVQPTLKVKQRGKWDFTRLPFKPGMRGPITCGNYMRERVRYYMSLSDKQEKYEHKEVSQGVVLTEPDLIKQAEKTIAQQKPTTAKQPNAFQRFIKWLFRIK